VGFGCNHLQIFSRGKQGERLNNRMPEIQVSKPDHTDSEGAASGREGWESGNRQNKEEAEYTDIVNTSLGKRTKCSICDVVLEDCRPYYRRYRVCPDCASKDSVLIAGKLHRFCQQCGKFQERYLFDGATRTCRDRLSRHAERRRNAAKRKRDKKGKEIPSEMPQAGSVVEKIEVSMDVNDAVVAVNHPGQKSRGSAFTSLQPSSSSMQVAHPTLYAREMHTETRPAIHRPQALRFNIPGPYGEEERMHAYAKLNKILDSLGILKQVREEAGFALPQGRSLKRVGSSPKMASSRRTRRGIPYQRDMGGLEADHNPAVPVVSRRSMSERTSGSVYPSPHVRVPVNGTEGARAKRPVFLRTNRENIVGSRVQQEMNDQEASQAATMQLLEQALRLADRGEQGILRDFVMKLIDSKSQHER